MARTGMFALDTTNPRFYTLGGRIHVKVALFGIIMFLVIMEVVEWVAYVRMDTVSVEVGWTEIVANIFELFVLTTLVIGFCKELALLLIPYIILMFLSLTTLALAFFQILFLVLFPFSEAANEIFEQNITAWQRIKTMLSVLALLAAVTTFFAWWLHIGLVCYQYFQTRQNERRTREAAVSNTSLPPLVSAELGARPAASRKPELQTPSFSNQNFSISDAEENDDDDEEKVFEKKGDKSAIY